MLIVERRPEKKRDPMVLELNEEEAREIYDTLSDTWIQSKALRKLVKSLGAWLGCQD